MNVEGQVDHKPELFGVLAILVVAFVVRVNQMGTMLDWFLFEDEFRTTGVILHLFKERTINPDHYFYPALGFYTNFVFFYLWGAVGAVGTVLDKGPSVVLGFFDAFSERDPLMIMLSRWVSLMFGLMSIAVAHLLARLFMHWKWALFCTLLLALNSVHVTMSVMAKVDTINLFWMVGGYYTGIRYYREGGMKWLIPASICTGFSVVSKNYLSLPVAMALIVPIRGFSQGRGILGLLGFKDLWIAGVLMAGSAFIGSPFSFIHLERTMQTAGWLYGQSEIISFYHTDPAVWWLDRYFYLLSIVFPFIFGLPLAWLTVYGTIHHIRTTMLKDPYLVCALVWFAWVFGSGSGGPKGGSFPYYLFMIVIPLALIVAVQALQDMTLSVRKPVRVLGYSLALLVFFWTLFRVDAFHQMYFQQYDDAGPWIRANLPADSEVLMISVHKPGPALGVKHFQVVWPHQFTEELMDESDPDVLIVDAWSVAGFRKVYRDLWVAPLVDSYLSGEKGYVEAARWKPWYLNRDYYTALDPEHDVEMILLKKKSFSLEGGP